ncbi:hypothetical protein DKM44_12680 [Deinococcus irradiatisoli]|uniref:Uncharacterized protein n=1 Tax=Deinococcus irradiatisoli TaxID=2202254 RepID=A0A2Z3JFL3_9DEIO|nr:hypothetical protein [Deinococcus irradiatisoli]AWN23977.1 hypothetical protein DKM44_12680 [Deinococcus irradiatisoli]
MTNRNFLSHRLSWRGVIAGLVVGLVVQLTLIALGTVITALTGITLTGVGIAAAVWLAISVLVAAYAAGLVAVRGSAPATLDGAPGIAAMTKDDATLTGLVTGSLLVLLGTLLGYNALSAATGTATSVLGGVLSGTSSLAGAATAGASQVAQTSTAQNIIGNLNQQDMADLIAQASPDLNDQQVTAAANVVGGIARRAANDLGDLSSVTQLSDFVSKRTDSIKKALTGDQLVTRLQRQGLTQAQAAEVQNSLGQDIDAAQKQLDDTAAATERIARHTASTAGWGWLLAAGLTLLLAVTGARNAASGTGR